MTYRGHVKDGVVILDGGAQLPEGAEVDVAVVEGRRPAVWDKLLKLSGKAEGLPKDAARNIDHYLYGTPKK